MAAEIADLAVRGANVLVVCSDSRPGSAKVSPNVCGRPLFRRGKVGFGSACVSKTGIQETLNCKFLSIVFISCTDPSSLLAYWKAPEVGVGLHVYSVCIREYMHISACLCRPVAFG